MQAIKGIYRNGRVELLETPKEISQAHVVVTFLDDDGKTTNDRESVVNLGEILDDDRLA